MNLEIEQYPGELKYLRQQVVKNKPQDTICKTHPDAPHGFNRNASLSEDRYVCDCEYWEPPADDTDELRQLVYEFFTNYLNLVEESESGRLFNPITIGCCRVMMLEPLDRLLDRMRELSGAKPNPLYKDSDRA